MLFDKIASFFYAFGKKLKEDAKFARFFYIGVVAVLVLIILIVAVACGKKDTEGTQETEEEETQQEAEVQEAQEAQQPDYTIPNVALEENAYADVNALINKYFDAMTNGDSATIQSLKDMADEEELIKIEKESGYIDEFDNIKVYTKPGPLTGSYVAFVYYEIKFTNINTLAPGLTTLYICSKEDGSLYICEGGMDEQVTAYIKGIVEQTDVADLFSMVETKYAEAVDADADLNAFMSSLSTKLDEEVSQAMAQAQPDESESAETEEPQETEPTENVMEEKVKATDTVNVRSSDSENADRIGQVAMGDTITRYEVKENGWSRVDYNGTEGYIKSEFLQPVDAAGNDTANETAQETTETEQTQTTTGSLAGKDKITIKETVNVRKSASETADKLGVAYQGENYELVMEQADGWCKIKYNGQTGYVKTEYVE